MAEAALRRMFRAVVSFLAFPAPAPAPRARVRRGRWPRPDDRAALTALARLHATLNREHFRGRLGRARFRLSDRMRTRLAEVRTAAGGPVEIGISRRHLERDGWQEVRRTLLHEMVHQWQAESGLPLDHGREFRRKAREVGVEASARRHVRPAAGRGETQREG